MISNNKIKKKSRTSWREKMKNAKSKREKRYILKLEKIKFLLALPQENQRNIKTSWKKRNG